VGAESNRSALSFTPIAASGGVEQGSVGTEEYRAAGEAGSKKTQDTPADHRGRGDTRCSNYSGNYGAGAGAGSAGAGSAGAGAGSAGAAAGASTGAGAGAEF